jgi:hypothetical protein
MFVPFLDYLHRFQYGIQTYLIEIASKSTDAEENINLFGYGGNSVKSYLSICRFTFDPFSALKGNVIPCKSFTVFLENPFSSKLIIFWYIH